MNLNETLLYFLEDLDVDLYSRLQGSTDEMPEIWALFIPNPKPRHAFLKQLENKENE